MAQNILVLHGPNLNLLGTREPEIYGHTTLDDINKRLLSLANSSDASCETFQSNYEGEIIERIHNAKSEGIDFIIINAGAYTHTSVALRDALVAVSIPFVEVHLSNVYKRESFRHQSYLADQACGVVSGLGIISYEAAMSYALSYNA